jgi:hypothetical protein
MKYQQLQEELTRLQTTAAEIQAAGDCITNARIDSSTPGGTARGAVGTQYRLRVKGKPARYLKPRELAEHRAAIARGKQLAAVQKKIAKVVAQLDAISLTAARLGLIAK